jgi:hypothetical protein
MFSRLKERGLRLAEARAARRRERLAARLAGAAEGVAVAVDGEAVVLSGRGLARRMDEDLELRWLLASGDLGARDE